MPKSKFKAICWVLLITVLGTAFGALPLFAKEKNSTLSKTKKTLAEAGISMARAAEDVGDWQKAVDLYANACEEDDVIFCAKAASLASEKMKDLNLALRYYRKGCEKGDSLSCYDYGHALNQTGKLEESRSFYETFCEKNKTHDAAIFCLRAGTLAAQAGDQDSAKYFLKTACDKKEPTGCFGLGLALKSEGSDDEAERYLASSCKQGVNEACGYLRDAKYAGQKLSKPKNKIGRKLERQPASH